MSGTPDSVAKVYLYLTPGEANGSPLVKTVHRPQLYRSLPGRITLWDNPYFAFASDLQPGNQITTVILPEDAFHLTSANFYAKDLASMTQALTANVNAASLGPKSANDADTVTTRTRYFMVVPQAYVPLVLAAELTPREAWIRLSTAIIADNRAVACAPLLDWLRVAATQSLPAFEADPPAPSTASHAPLSVPVPDQSLAQQRWELVMIDMPQLSGATRMQEQAIMHAVAAMQASQQAASTAALLEWDVARAPKLPSSRFPASVDALLLVTGAPGEHALPPIWHLLANATKSEMRGCLQSAFFARSRQASAATADVPTLTKEILECFTQRRLFAAANSDA